MRERFPEYFNKPDIKKMWETAIFVPDTNVLLDIFRFPPESSKGLLKILKHLKDRDRLWIPYQFTHEYINSLPAICDNIRVDYQRKKSLMNQKCGELMPRLEDLDKLTDYDLKKQIDSIKNIFEVAKKGLKKSRKEHERRLESEDLKGQIETLLQGVIGREWSDKRLAKTYKKGQWRYSLRRPPGFKDENKPMSQGYGDLVGWLQIIEFAGSQDTEQPIIMITRDSSGDDWFYKPEVHKDEVAPRPELVKEMRNKAGVDFYLYQTGEFMELANEYLKDDLVSETAIEEAKARKHDGFRSQFPNMYSYIDEELRKFVAPISPFDPLKPLKLLSSSDPDMYAKLFPPFDPDMYAKLLPPFDYGSRPPNVDNIDDDLDMSDETQDDNVDDNDDHEPPPSPDDDKSI